MEIAARWWAPLQPTVVAVKCPPRRLVIHCSAEHGQDGIGGGHRLLQGPRPAEPENRGQRGAEGQRSHGASSSALFRDPEVTRLIRRCNDFGAGGVPAAIGELADGSDLDRPPQVRGLTALSFAISESQERMAVVVAGEGRRTPFCPCRGELGGHRSWPKGTEEPRPVHGAGKTTADLSREFLAPTVRKSTRA